LEPKTLDMNIHLAKSIYNAQFKKRAPRAIRAIRKRTLTYMKTSDVRIDQKLNKFVWSQGIRNLPRRVRVRMSRRRNEDEDAKEKFYTLVQHIPVPSFKKLKIEVVTEE